jgi:hypothetical protein
VADFRDMLPAEGAFDDVATRQVGRPDRAHAARGARADARCGPASALDSPSYAL